MSVYGRRVLAMVLGAGIGACSGETAEERAAEAPDSLSQTGSYYTRDADSSMQVEGTATSDMLTAPAIITPVRLSLGQLATGAQSEDDPDRASHKTLLADLVAAMQTDLNRLGVRDNEDLQALGDSVVNDVGGGTGAGEGPDAGDVQEHVQQVERLIALYESKVQSAGTSAGDSASH
jgi:hypothetical protein